MTTFLAPKYTNNSRLDGKTAIITGCNTGLGKYLALNLCRRGCRVIMACRNIPKAEEAKNEILNRIENCHKIGVLIIKELDLASLSSVRKRAKEILDEEERIDLLINNAGVCGCPQGLTEDGYEIQLATNHLGHFLLTLLLLPRITRSGPARIINVSSKIHERWGDTNFEDINYENHPYSPVRAYARSKLANILFTLELAKKLEGTKVNVYAVHPGIVNTDAQRYWKEAHPYLSIIGNWIMYWVFRTPKQGAQTILYCALDEKVLKESGLYYDNCAATTPSHDAEDENLAGKLWDLSVKWAKLGDFDFFKEKDNNSKLI